MKYKNEDGGNDIFAKLFHDLNFRLEDVLKNAEAGEGTIKDNMNDLKERTPKRTYVEVAKVGSGGIRKHRILRSTESVILCFWIPPVWEMAQRLMNITRK